MGGIGLLLGFTPHAKYICNSAYFQDSVRNPFLPPPSRLGNPLVDMGFAVEGWMPQRDSFVVQLAELCAAEASHWLLDVTTSSCMLPAYLYQELE